MQSKSKYSKTVALNEMQFKNFCSFLWMYLLCHMQSYDMVN